MNEGHEADVFPMQALLAGVVNRLGDGKVPPVTVEPPAWMSRREVKATRDELDLARAAFREYVGTRARSGGGGA